MKKILVMKFGGTSLLTAERIKEAAKIVQREAAGDHQTIVVVSAMGHSTDALINLSDEITAMANQRELDALMATGEQISATLMAMALQSLGVQARSFSGAQAGIITDSHFNNAKIKKIRTRALLECLKGGVIPVVTGFQGTTRKGEITTLGRGGSDTTAIELAASVKAERCDIYSDVDGIYSADPRIIPGALKLDQISASEMFELANNGAQILNARSVEVARRRQVSVRVRSTFKPTDQGTLVTGCDHKIREFTGVAMRKNINCIELNLEKLELGCDRHLSTLRQQRFQTKLHLLKLLAEAAIEAEIVDPIRPNPFRIPVIVSKSDTGGALATLHQADLSNRQICINTEMASITTVATEITAEQQADALATLAEHNIPVAAVGMDQQRLTLLVPIAQAEEGLQLLHSLWRNVSAADSHQLEWQSELTTQRSNRSA